MNGITAFWRILVLAAGLFLITGCAEDGETAPSDDGAAAEGATADGAEVAAAAPPPVPDIGGRRDWSGPLAAAAVDLTVTARDQRGWDILWQLVGQPQPGPLPDAAMAVGVFIGSRPTAGFAVNITDVQPGETGITVRYAETTPQDPDIAAQQITAPYTVRLLSLTDQPVTFIAGQR